MAKQIIRLTEGDLHKIIKESVKKIIREGNYGDWRDDFDAYNSFLGDPSKGDELGRKYYDKLKQQYNGDKVAMRKAMNDHFKEKDAAREKRLSKTDPEYLDWENAFDKKYDLENGINVDDNESIDNFDFDAEKARQAAKRERKMASASSPRNRAKEISNTSTPSKFSGMSPEELEKMGANMGYFK